MNFNSKQRIAHFTSNDKTDELLAFGVSNDFTTQLEDEALNIFKEIDQFISDNQGKYIFLAISYDLKNHIENLESKNEDSVDFPLLKMWTSETILAFKNESVTVLEGESNEKIAAYLKEYKKLENSLPEIKFQSRLTKSEYLKHISTVKKEIKYGNIYELNYCQEYFARDIPEYAPFSLFRRLNELTQAPFSAYLNLENHAVFCGSPERFLRKNGNILISQPIKGTIKRSHNEDEDQELRQKLKSDPKEISENVMIVDLVRNDLSKIAQKNSVNVDELCGLYSFGTVHQLISTISCELKQETSFSSILKATFPMGSMTGAPKISAMKISEREENFKRGLYSGSIGYIKPNGDFDLNVVIRSIVHNKKENYLSIAVGGAITDKSIPESEYEECQVKIKKIIDLFDGK
jgi:para-aminobenzoate synthetase component 1